MRNFVKMRWSKVLLKRMMVSLMCIVILLSMVAGSAENYPVLAEEKEHYDNVGTGYQAVIDDMADMFDENVLFICRSDLEYFTNYGNAIVLFMDDSDSVQPDKYYHERYGYGADYDGYVTDELLAEHPNADGALLVITPQNFSMYTFGSVAGIIGHLQIGDILPHAIHDQ